MSTVERIVIILNNSLSGNNEAIRSAQHELQSYHNDQNFIVHLLSIPLLNNVDKKIAKLAIVYIKSVLRIFVTQNNQAYINIWVNQMFGYLQKSDIPFQYRYDVSGYIQYAIHADSKQIIISAYQPNFANLIKKAVQDPLNQINFEYLSLMAKVLSDSTISQIKTPHFSFFQETFIPISTLGLKLLKYAAQMTNITDAIIQKFVWLSQIISGVLKKYLKRFMFYQASNTQLLFQPIFSELIISSLQFNLAENQISNSIIYWRKDVPGLQKTISLFHQFKANNVYSLTQTMRILSNTKNIDVDSHLLIKNGPSLILGFISTLNQLLEKTKYYKIKNKYLAELIEEIIHYLNSSIRSGRFYATFLQQKPLLVYGIVFEILQFSYEDCQDYYHNPEQFMNSLIHTVQMDSEALLKQKAKNDNEVEIQNYSSLKSTTATMLKILCKYLDGSLSEIFEFSFSALENKLNTKYSNILLLTVIAILRDEVKQRQQIKSKLAKFIFTNLNQMELPKKSTQQPYSTQKLQIDMEYSLSLIVLWRYFFRLSQYTYNFYGKVFNLVQMILGSAEIEQVPKLITCQIISLMAQDRQADKMVISVLNLLNGILNPRQIYIKYIETIHIIITKNNQQISKNPEVLQVTLDKSSKLLKQLLTNNKKDHKIIIDHIWHIFTAIASSTQLVYALRNKLYESLNPFVKMIDGDNDIKIQAHFFKIVSQMIRLTANVTEFDLNVIKILPQIFYKGESKYELSSSFECLQLVIFYGRDLLAQHSSQLKALIVLCIQSISKKTVNQKIRSEADQVEGLLILQSIMISCSDLFGAQMWIQLKDSLLQIFFKYQILTDFFFSNFISTIGLIMMYGHKHFPVEENEKIMQLLLSKYNHYSEQAACKLFVISMGELLTCYQYPYIQKRFIHLLDCIVTLLKLICTKKGEVFTLEDLNDQQRQYRQLRCKVITKFTDLDQFQVFRSQIQKLREVNQPIFQNTLAQLPEIKRDYLRQILHVRKVHAQMRKIIKIKRNNQQNVMQSENP